MTFEAFHQSLIDALRRARLDMSPFPDVVLDVRTLCRTATVYLHGPYGRLGRGLASGGRVSFRWDAVETYRQHFREEGAVTRLFGDRSRRRTVPGSVRIDLRLSANVVNARHLPDPSPKAWRAWRAAIVDLGGEGGLVDLNRNGIDAQGRLTVVAWHGEPEVKHSFAPDGSLQLVGLQLEAWEGVPVPRHWDDSSRREDPHPDLDGLAMRWAAGFERWTEALQFLDSPQG